MIFFHKIQKWVSGWIVRFLVRGEGGGFSSGNRLYESNRDVLVVLLCFAGPNYHVMAQYFTKDLGAKTLEITLSVPIKYPHFGLMFEKKHEHFSEVQICVAYKHFHDICATDDQK